MRKDDPRRDDGLDPLFDAARRQAATPPSPDFMARLRSDADRLQPRHHAAPAGSGWARLLREGPRPWEGAAGLVAAGLCGLWIGGLWTEGALSVAEGWNAALGSSYDLADLGPGAVLSVLEGE